MDELEEKLLRIANRENVILGDAISDTDALAAATQRIIDKGWFNRILHTITDEGRAALAEKA